MTQYSAQNSENIDYPAVIAQLQHQLTNLTNQVQHMSTQPGPATVEPAPISRSPKVSLPAKFSGDRRSFRGFLFQLELVFRVRPADYYSDSLKIATFGTLLDGKALKWFLPYLEKQLIDTMTWETFKITATETFGEPCRKLNAETRLMNLVQSGSLIDYVSEFTSLSSEIEWSENALISHFRRGLNPSLLDLMVTYEVPSTLTEMVTLATQVDNRVWESKQIRRQLSKSVQHSNSRAPKQSPRPMNSPVPAPKDPYAMDLDASKKGPISAEERKRRYDSKLCLYCGNPGHRVSECPLKSRQLDASTIEQKVQGKANRQ